MVMKIKEDQLQANCIIWFRAQYKHLYWRLMAIPNGGKRNVITAAIMKRTGTLSGAWDLFLSVPKSNYSGMFIEVKVGKNKLTDNQIEFLRENCPNYWMKVCYSLDEFIKDVDFYLKEMA